MKKAILNILALTVILMTVGFVAAAHTSSVEVSPSGWLAPSTSYDFEFTVTNNGPDSINDVTIDGDLNFGSLVCGSAPSGWDLYSSSSSHCRYTTNTVDNFITSGNEKIFEITTTTLGSFGDKAWLITTREPGEVGTQSNNVYLTVQTIQNAIDDAEEGDTIEVPAGTYNENVVINKDGLHLVGVGSDSTIIAPVSGNSISIRAIDFCNIDGVYIEGFTLEGVVGQITLHAVSGGCDPAPSAYTTNLAITDVIINGVDESNHGIGLNSVDGVTLTNVQVNNVKGNGIKALELTGVRNLILTDSLFENNYVAVRVQGGFDADSNYGSNGPITITNSRFNNNALAVQSSDSKITIDAENNWWGTAIESEILALISGDIDYDPWCYDAQCSADTTAPTIEFIGAPYFNQVDIEVIITAIISDDRGLANYTVYSEDENVTVEITEDHVTLEEVFVSTVYDEEGEYMVTLTATDATGNSKTETTVVVISGEKPDWIIPLYADRMNLISIPLVPENTNYKVVLDGIKDNLDRVWAYTIECDEDGKNCKNGWHYQYTISSGDGWTTSTGADLKEIVPGYGYIVFMKNDDVLYGDARTISGDPDSEPELPASVKLANGWNLIGHFGNAPKPIVTALASLVSLEGYPYWYKLYNVNHQEFTEDMTSGEGYWIAMKHLPDTTTTDYYTYYP